MANFVYTEATRAFMEAELDLNATDDVRMIIVMSNTTTDTEEDVTTMGGFTTLDEYDGTGYVAGGQTLDNEVVNKDDANNRSEFDADDEVFSNLGVGTRQAVAIVVFKFITSFSLSLPLAFMDTGGFPFDGNGNDVTFEWNAEGIIQLQA